MKFKVESGGSLHGAIRVPGDKSMSHRTVMLGALAEGTTIATGFLEGHDALCTVQAFKDMGVTVRGPQNGRIEIDGVGMQWLPIPWGRCRQSAVRQQEAQCLPMRWQPTRQR